MFGFLPEEKTPAVVSAPTAFKVSMYCFCMITCSLYFEEKPYNFIRLSHELWFAITKNNFVPDFKMVNNIGKKKRNK